MWFFRALLYICIGIGIGLFHVFILSQLQFPFSQLPLFAILISLALVNRTQPRVFLILLVAVFFTDLYSAAFVGVGVISLMLSTLAGLRISNDFVTHRSLIGCAVISVVVGVVWVAVSVGCISLLQWWRYGVSSVGLISNIIVVSIVRIAVCALVCAVIYVLTPRWFVTRSPVVVGLRTL